MLILKELSGFSRQQGFQRYLLILHSLDKLNNVERFGDFPGAILQHSNLGFHRPAACAVVGAKADLGSPPVPQLAFP
jgi:hypothetical protein